MNDQASFHGSTGTGGRGQRLIATLTAVVVLVFIGVALVKPWGNPVERTSPTPGPSSRAAASAPESSSRAATAPPTTATPTPVAPRPDAFTVPIPPPATAAWTGLRWRQLAPDDPLNLVRSELRWRRGFIAVGWASSGGVTTTPVWTSGDGASWEPLPFGTGMTFWPGLAVLRVAEVHGGLVALTDLGDPTHCSAGQGCLPVMSWTSPDGRAWSPRRFPDLAPLEGSTSAPLVAEGPAGLVAVSTGASAHAARSLDGVHWTVLPDGTIPKDVAVADLRGMATGYVLGGSAVSGDNTSVGAATEWSADGRVWTRTPPLPLASGSGTVLASTALPTAVTSFVVGRDGLIAVGRFVATPGAEIWWHSADGRRWQMLNGYPPLGPTTCIGEGCGGQPNGVLTGDGQRMVALRGGSNAGAWTSSDGLAWRRLVVTGDLPSERATQAVILPGGVLLSDGSTTWFGEAVAQ